MTVERCLDDHIKAKLRLVLVLINNTTQHNTTQQNTRCRDDYITENLMLQNNNIDDFVFRAAHTVASHKELGYKPKYGHGQH